MSVRASSNISISMFKDHITWLPTASTTPPPELCSIDETYKYIFLPICYSFTFIFSISLNSVILYRSFRQTKRWNASLIYMVNLASTDFMYGLSLPFLVASYIMRDRWVFGDFMCRLVRFLFYFNLYCSISFLTCISVHRYLGICHPMKVITLETKKAVKCTCVVVWIVVFALTCPIFRFAQTGHVTRLTGLSSNVSNAKNQSHEVSLPNGNGSSANMGRVIEEYQNCWDDAIDEEFPDYIPYGITLHLLGFFVPFSVIAWCYSHVVLTIFRTLHFQSSSHQVARESGQERCEWRKRHSPAFAEKGRRGSIEMTMGTDDGISVFLGAHSSNANRRRKSIKTIITITILFALCFFPFHVTKTIFLLLKVNKGVPCRTMTMVSMCYKITRPLASFNAWLNALLYFLTKDKGAAHCCQARNNNTQQDGGQLLPLRTAGKEDNPVRGTLQEKDSTEASRAFPGSSSNKKRVKF